MFFHPNCGENIKLVNARLTAEKPSHVTQNTLVFSGYPLNGDFKFFIRVIRKNEGHRKHIMKIGVTTLDPNIAPVIPKSIETLHRYADTWFLFGDWVANNQSLNGARYGGNINSMKEGDIVGILRTSEGDLEYSVNGRNLGVAARDIPSNVYGVIDLCGLAYQVSICSKFQDGSVSPTCSASFSSLSPPDNQTCAQFQVLSDMNFECNVRAIDTTHGAIPKGKLTKAIEDKLRFHKRTGTLVKLSTSRRTAQRRHPLDEFNNGVVMTHRYLLDDELFEIRIDCLVNKWSGSIEMGVTSHNPSAMEFPATMTNMRTGTIMMSGCGILTNGRGTRREYGNFNLDQLQAGDKVGLIRKANGNLHYYINGLDQGVAVSRINQQVWGVVDLYGMTVKVSIMDPDGEDLEEHEDIMNVLEIGESSKAPALPASLPRGNPDNSPSCSQDVLAFHPNCGAHAVVINNGQTAHRPFAQDDFNNGVVLTNRPLRQDELFEVRLEKIISKWAGSIEIGVTMHSPDDLEFPFTMTNMKSGTWMMTGIGIMHNRVTVREQYATSSLDQLGVGDRVGVVRQACGTLRFYVNGIDQGPATSNIPEGVYGVIDLYGQAAQASIVQLASPPESLQSSYSNATLHGGELAFHRICGDNVTIGRNGDIAYRFKKKIVKNNLLLSNRPLREFEMFQVRVDNKEFNCCGLISMGVTTQFPTKVVLPPIPQDLCREIYMLEGNNLYNNNARNRRPYTFDIDTIPVGTLLGVMRHADRSVHFYVDGVDQGKAWDIHNINMFAVIDLNGQCTQVTITPPKPRAFANSENSLMLYTGSSQIKQHTFSEYSGANVRVLSDGSRAVSSSFTPSGKLVFSSALLKLDEIFEFEVMACDHNLIGSLKVGVTDFNILNAHVNCNIPSHIEGLPMNTYYIDEQFLKNNINSNVGFATFNLRNLRSKDTVGLRRIGYTDAICLIINSVERGVVFEKIPDKVFVVVEINGPPQGLRVTSLDGQLDMSGGPEDNLHSVHMIDSIGNHSEDCVYLPVNRIMRGTHAKRRPSLPFVGFHTPEFYCHHGPNIILDPEVRSVYRENTYNHGLVVANRQIIRGQSYQVSVQKINTKWMGSLGVGAARHWLPNCFPPSAADLGVGYWIVTYDTLYLDGYKKKTDYGQILDRLRVGAIVSILFTEQGELQMVVDSVNFGTFVKINPKFRELYPIIDMYGKCEQAAFLNAPEDGDTVEVSMLDDLSNSVTVTVKGNQIDDTHNDDVASGYDATQQCEKADLEYHEKETFHGYEDFAKVPEGSSIAKSISYDESLDILMQNPCVANELKNIEIKNKSVLSIQRKECSNVWTKCFDSIDLPPSMGITDPRSPFQHSFPFTSEDEKSIVSNLSRSLSSQHMSAAPAAAIAPPEAFAGASNVELPRAAFFKDPGKPNSDRFNQIMSAMIEHFEVENAIVSVYHGPDMNEHTSITTGDDFRTPEIDCNHGFANNGLLTDSYKMDGDPVTEGIHCNNMSCVYMRQLLLYRQQMILPDCFSNAYPRCFCHACYLAVPSSRIPHGWVRFPIRGFENPNPKWDRGYWHVPPWAANQALMMGNCQDAPFRLDRALHSTTESKSLKQRFRASRGRTYFLGAAIEVALCLGDKNICRGCPKGTHAWNAVNSYRFIAVYLHLIVEHDFDYSDSESEVDENEDENENEDDDEDEDGDGYGDGEDN